MKKMEYIAPEEQIVKLQMKKSLLVGSGGEGSEGPSGGGLDD